MNFNYVEYLMNRMTREEKLKEKEIARRERQKAYKERMQAQELENE